jgi:hypothetical protein
LLPRQGEVVWGNAEVRLMRFRGPIVRLRHTKGWRG